MNVLIADDNMNYIKSLINFIISKNDKIKILGIANNGYEVINRVEEDNVELLILDLKMPSCNGIEVIDKIIKMDLPKRPIIFVLTGEMEMLNSLMNKNVVECIANKTDGIDNIMYKINEIVKNNDNNSSRVKNRIINELLKIGYRLKHKGTKYIIDSILFLYYQSNQDLNNLEKYTYRYVAKKYKKTVANIKTNIVKATEYVYWESDEENLKKYFKKDYYEKPTPKNVIIEVLNRIL